MAGIAETVTPHAIAEAMTRAETVASRPGHDRSEPFPDPVETVRAYDSAQRMPDGALSYPGPGEGHPGQHWPSLLGRLARTAAPSGRPARDACGPNWPEVTCYG